MIVFDLDGTLALVAHRQHYLRRPPAERDWDAFSEACHLDEPNQVIIDTCLMSVRSGARVEIWSGRSASVLTKTTDWLARYHLGEIPLKMREIGDHRDDRIVKREWYDAAPVKPFLMYDDRDKVVAMWRELGVVCCQVAPGDF